MYDELNKVQRGLLASNLILTSFGSAPGWAVLAIAYLLFHNGPALGFRKIVNMAETLHSETLEYI